jgi:hypothetical protein
MKKLFALMLAMLMVFALCACGASPAPAAEKEPAVVGGWTLSEDAALSEEARAAFEKAMEGFTGVGYEPLALIGTQVVSGTNYCILCEGRVIVPDAAPYYALVYVYADLKGGAQILNIAALDLGDIAETGEIKAADPTSGNLLGGWKVDRDSAVELDGALLHLASQVVNGTNHCVLCRGGKLVFVYESLDGKIELKREVTLDPGALGG